MAFRKGDRVVITGVGSASDADEWVGSVGTVQQCRAGGAVAVVVLDDRRRVSIAQQHLGRHVQ